MKESIFDGDADGEGAAKDERLKKQLERVYAALTGERWMTLEAIATVAKAPEASVSARLRDLRKERFGGFRIDQQIAGPNGLHEYRLLNGSGNPELVSSPLKETSTPVIPCPHCAGSGVVASPPSLHANIPGQAELF